MSRTIVIAEAGVNHNGSENLAKELIDAAVEAGADFVKFQTFKAAEISGQNAPLAEYQARALKDSGSSQLEMLKKLELSWQQHHNLLDYCKKKEISFISTPFDCESLRFLHEELDIALIKIPSGELFNPLLLLDAGRTGKPLVLSTGMSTLADIETALGVLAFGILEPRSAPSQYAFRDIFTSEQGQKALKERVTLLHCVTQYPAPVAATNLRAIDSMAAAFGLGVGFSDHSPGISMALAAVARGAIMIEKHFTIDRNLPGPDHKASLEPHELKAMISGIREVESGLGDGRKIPTPAELQICRVARRSLVAAADIAAGQVLGCDNVGLKRPGTGISPMQYFEILGKVAPRDFKKGEQLEF